VPEIGTLNTRDFGPGLMDSVAIRPECEMARINLDDIYHIETTDALREAYDTWAEDYDQQLDTELGYQGWDLMISQVVGRLAKDALILDAGAGTGLLGAALARAGYSTIDGIDLSQGMLARARALGVYRRLDVAVLGETLEAGDDTYDAVLSSGVFTPGHAPPESFFELIRITRPGGMIGFTMRDDGRPEGFVAMFGRLEGEGLWRPSGHSEPILTLSRGDRRYTQRFWGFEVL
jgi:predicted TPR repeat methyltransferase